MANPLILLGAGWVSKQVSLAVATTGHSSTVYILDSKTFATYFFDMVHLIPSWLVWAEIECTTVPWNS